MKRKFFSAILIIFTLVSINAKDNPLHVDILNFSATPGSKYAELSTVYVEYDKLKDGNVNIKYNFSLNSEKYKEDELVNMRIEFSSHVKYFVTAFDGLQAFEFDGEQVPALLEHETYAECFIPVRKGGNGFIELQLTIPRDYVGTDIPIKITFVGYQRFSIASLLVAGVVNRFVPFAGTIIACNKTKLKTAQIEERFSEIKEKYKKISMADSMKGYRIQVR